MFCYVNETSVSLETLEPSLDEPFPSDKSITGAHNIVRCIYFTIDCHYQLFPVDNKNTHFFCLYKGIEGMSLNTPQNIWNFFVCMYNSELHKSIVMYVIDS